VPRQKLFEPFGHVEKSSHRLAGSWIDGNSLVNPILHGDEGQYARKSTVPVSGLRAGLPLNLVEVSVGLSASLRNGPWPFVKIDHPFSGRVIPDLLSQGFDDPESDFRVAPAAKTSFGAGQDFFDFCQPFRG
jgi:hypothetical protein